MKLSRIKFWVLYIPFYIFLPCAIDVKCAENDARLNIWSFDLLGDKLYERDPSRIMLPFGFLDHKPPYDEYEYKDIDVLHRFICNKSDFRLFLKEVVRETKELKKKNAMDIKKGVHIDERGKTFNKRVLVINRDKLKIILEEFIDILGCQECPTFLFYDETGKITDYNTFCNFCSDYLKNGKRKVGMKRINKQKLKCDSPLRKIFNNDKRTFDIITKYYSNDDRKSRNDKIIKKLFDLKKKIIKDIKKSNSSENIISKNGLGHEILNFKALCEKYQQAENAILSYNLNSRNTDTLHDVLSSYIFWRKILLQAQIIKVFIHFFGKENIVKENEEIIKENIGPNIPDDFKDNYTEFFFSDNFSTADYSALIKNIKGNKTVKNTLNFVDNFSYDSFLDLFWVYCKCKNVIDLLPDGIFSRLNNFLNKLKNGTLFEEKKNVLFKIVEIAASNGTGFNKNVFYKLDAQIKDHFNSIIFDYLTNFLRRVKKNVEDAGWERTTYDFHNVNKVIEIIRVLSNYINPVLKKKEGRPELIYNAILLLMEEMKTLSISSYINCILMEGSMVLNTLIEYFFYTKDFNAYVSESSKRKQLSLKQNNISNKFDNFCIINQEEYASLFSLNAPASGIIKSVAQRLYEYREDGQKNNPFFKIVVMGDMRAGKTLLIRSFFEEKDRFKFKVANGDTSTTCKVTSYTRTYKNIEEYIQITDTPGFEGIEKGKDRGQQAISKNFNDLFSGDDTVVLDIVLFKKGCIDWLSESHKDIITRVLNETGNKIIFLIPFTSLNKNAPKVKEDFLASLFYNLYVRGKEFPLNEKELKENYKNFMERVIAIPINQLYSEENNESRFGLIEMGKAVIQCLSEEKQEGIYFSNSFMDSLPGNELCEKDFGGIEDNEINSDENSQEKYNINNRSENSSMLLSDENIENNDNCEKEKIGSLKDLILETLVGFNNFKLKMEKPKLIQPEALPEIDEKCSWYHKDKESYKLLNYVYLLYLGCSSIINQLCTKSYNPLLYEINKTEIYKLAEFITSPYFFNYLCLDNENLNYNIFFFKEEIDLLNDQKNIQKVLEEKKVLAQFCLVADDPFLISKGDYVDIKEACVKFNSNYDDFNPLSIVKDAMETNYDQIKENLATYFKEKEKNKKKNIDEKYLNFVVCYDTTQQRYIIDRTNLCFLGINLERDKKNKLYEEIPKSLENYIKDLNGAIKEIKSYEDFLKEIGDENNKDVLYRRYHHPGKKQLIRMIELNRIREVLDPTEKEKEKKKEDDKGNIEEKKEEPKIEEEKEDKTIDGIKGKEIIEEKKNERLIDFLNCFNPLRGFID